MPECQSNQTHKPGGGVGGGGGERERERGGE
jgi:hypothetical protein